MRTGSATILIILLSLALPIARAAPVLTVTGVSFATYPLYDDSGNAYSGVQWTPGGPSIPAALPCNQYIQGWVDFAASGVDADYSIKFWGESATRAFTNVTFVLYTGQTNRTSATLTKETTPNYVGFANPWSVTWKYTVNGGATNTLATSTIPTYLLLTTPLSGVILYHSVVHNACATTGATTADQAVANSWSRFTSAATKRWNNGTLYYYQPGIAWANGYSIVDYLMFYGNAQCGAWQGFLKDVFGANGIASTPVQVTTKVAGDVYFAVNNWTLNNTGTGSAPYKWRIVSHTPTSAWSMVSNYNSGNYGDLTSSATLYGQGSSPNAPAEKIFGNHQILKRTSSGGTATYYDPSYGVTYTGSSKSAGEAAFDANSVFGFTTAWTATNGTSWSQTYVRTNNPASTEVQFSN